MTIELMQGAHQAISFVNDYLKRDLPARLLVYRNGWDLDDITLPEPKKYLNYEPATMDSEDWPLVYTVVISTNELVRTDYTDGWDPMYRVSYSCRTYIWCSSDGAEDSDDDGLWDPSEVATTMRNRLVTIIRSAVLDHQCLQAAGNTRMDVLVDETSIREEFSDVSLLKGQRVLCGAYLAYTINLNEVVARATIGEVEDIELTMGTILEVTT